MRSLLPPAVHQVDGHINKDIRHNQRKFPREERPREELGRVKCVAWKECLEWLNSGELGTWQKVDHDIC